MYAARVCRAPQLQWLTHCPDSLMLPLAPAKPAQQGPLAPALRAHQAHWTLPCPADLQIRRPAHGRHALPTSWPHLGPPDAWSWSGGVTAATASLQKKTDPTKLHPCSLSYLTRSCWDLLQPLFTSILRYHCGAADSGTGGAWPALPPSVPSVSVCYCLSFCVLVSLCFPVLTRPVSDPLCLCKSPHAFSVIRET